jgi:chromosomal replication initiator protein
VTEAGELWTKCADLLRGEVTDAIWLTWMAALEPVGVDGRTLVVSAPSSLVRDRLEERHSGVLEKVVAQAAGTTAEIRIVVRPTPEGVGVPGPVTDEALPTPIPATTVADSGQSVQSGTIPSFHRAGQLAQEGQSVPIGRSGGFQPPMNSTPSVTGHPTGRVDPPSLNPRYTFDAFVIGSSNRFAHAAAQRVAETPATSYNPLFIYGDSGLGKTHLLHAIGHYGMDNFPGMRIRYVSTETFMNDFVDAIRNNSQMIFKRHYRDCDILLVDDIQFMEGKEGLQEEFFHTFNSLYEGSRQIVLSSDRHPRSIATLEDRLRSRFEWGLTTDVQPPELETRLAILRKKADGERIPIPGEVLELIATHVRDNIRELEGALIRVSAFASLNQEPPTQAMAERVLSDILDFGRPRQITPKVIMDAVATTFGFTVEDLCGTSRRRPLVNARQIGMYVFRELTDFSYPAIAREFGGRDHTTVIHAVEKVSGLMKERRQIYDQVTELIYSIKGGA